MAWQRLGQVYVPDGAQPELRTHAANPVAEPLDGDRVRVWFSGRDDSNRSSIGWFELDLADPLRQKQVAVPPVLAPGDVGLFDDSGVSMGCLVAADDRRLLYYTGWNLGVTVPWRNSIGLAVASAGSLQFRRRPAPILDRSEVDPFSLSYPWVLREGSRWRMWYGSNLTWGRTPSAMTHVVKYAESDDGVHWRRQGRVAIPLAGGDETMIARPCVLRTEAGYRMWFAHRGATYRIGHAVSADGIEWARCDADAGLDPASSGWDAEMVCYPCVFAARGRLHLLYNGNAFGATGIGLAVWREPRP